MTPAISVRLAGMADAQLVWGFASEFPSDMVHDRDAFMTMYPRMISREDRYLAVAEVGEKAVGYVVASIAETFFANAPVVWISEMLVDPAERLHGVGTALITAVEEWAHDRGAAWVSVVVDESIGFYESRGFRREGIHLIKVTP